NKAVNLPTYSSVVSELWVSCSKPNPQARVRLFCFPYAGAGSSMFHIWTNLLLPEVEVYLIHLPGRDKRINEQPYKLLLPLAEVLATALGPYLNKSFAFFGHSLGGLLAFETVRQLRRQQAAQPVHLFISARFPPHKADPYAHLYQLPEP